MTVLCILLLQNISVFVGHISSYCLRFQHSLKAEYLHTHTNTHANTHTHARAYFIENEVGTNEGKCMQTSRRKYVGNRRHGRREGSWESALKWTIKSMIGKVFARFIGLRIGKWWVCTLCSLNTLRTGSFKLLKTPFPGFLTILTL